MNRTRHVVIDGDLHEKLRRAAQAEGRHMKALVERAIKDDLRRKELVQPHREGR